MSEMYKKGTQEVSVYSPKELTKRGGTVKQELRKYWSRDEIHSRLDLIENPRDRMFFQFLWMSGVRVTEAVSLTKQDLDLSNYVMTVKHLKSRKYEHRVVPLHPMLVEVLRVYTAQMNNPDRVFPFSRQRADQLAKKYDLGNCHMLRHSFSVNWLRCGGDIVTLHRILGHSKIQTTMEYLRIVPMDQGKELLKIQF